MHAYTRVHTEMHSFMCTLTCTCSGTQVTHVHAYPYVQKRIHVHDVLQLTRACAPANVCMYILTYSCMCTHVTRMDAHTHTHTHTHTHKLSMLLYRLLPCTQAHVRSNLEDCLSMKSVAHEVFLRDTFSWLFTL